MSQNVSYIHCTSKSYSAFDIIAFSYNLYFLWNTEGPFNHIPKLNGSPFIHIPGHWRIGTSLGED